MSQGSVTYIHQHQADERRKGETPGISPEPWMTYEDVAKHLKRPVRAAYNYVYNNGITKHYPFDDRPYFKPSEIFEPKVGRPKGRRKRR